MTNSKSEMKKSYYLSKNGLLTLHKAPHPSSFRLFKDRIKVSIPPLGALGRKFASCMAPSHPILLLVRSSDLILLVPPNIFTMASMLSSVKLLFAKDNLSEKSNG